MPLRLAALLALLAAAAPAQPAGRRVSDIAPPGGCSRPATAPGSYSEWLRSTPLKPDGTILSHAGDTIGPGFYRVLAVSGLPLLFRDDLEQCADWCFRFWAEHHRESGRLDRLYLFDYSGRKRIFAKSGKTFLSFLRRAMADANSHSLKRGCAAVDPADIMPGDMLVQNRDGGIGHVSIVMDVCRDPSGNRYFLMGYGFMPAQEFHLERADTPSGRDGWFTLTGYLDYLEKHFDFGDPAFRRFR